MKHPEKVLRQNIVFAEAPWPLGTLWQELCTVENQLATMLLEQPAGMVVAGNRFAWRLAETDGQWVLETAPIGNGKPAEFVSRFDFELEYVDLGEDELRDAIDAVSDAVADFAALNRLAN